MAERSQKLAAIHGPQLGKSGRDEDAKGRGEAAMMRERKKPMRLEERKRAEMERKRAHKMMRQISDESSDEEVKEKETKRPGEQDKDREQQQEQQQQQRHTNNSSSKMAKVGELRNSKSSEGIIWIIYISHIIMGRRDWIHLLVT